MNNIKKNKLLVLTFLVIVFIIVTFIIVIKREDEEFNDSSANGNEVKVISSALTLEDFEFLQYGLSFTEIVEEVGDPDVTFGSGVSWYTYMLEDGSVVNLMFASLDTLLFAEVENSGNGSSSVLVDEAE
jgi:hypothetical protein